jgi:ribosomal protein S12 methylthiotransferase accessory factor
MGITRVANITGLDRIGVPVTMVVRPNSRSLAVSQGKGLSLVSSRVSAIMESVETFHAERIEQALRLTSQHVLSRSERIVDVDRLPKSRERSFSEHARILWIQGQELFSGEHRWLPYETVHTDFTWPRPSGSGYFPGNTNGLASGNVALEAIAHALYEVIERDALALKAQNSSSDHYSIDVASIDDPDCCKVLDAISSANLQLRIWDVTSDTGIACFECLIMGQDERNADPEFGSGCHPDSKVALLRALTEAVQARTTFIAGSRDDYGRAAYTDKAREDRHCACRQLMQIEETAKSFSAVESRSFDTLAEDLSWVLNRLSAIGIDEVVWVDLSLKALGIPVARVVVPGLEGAFKGASSDYVPGDRAKRAASS